MLDERTVKYFESIKKHMGYLGTNYGYLGIEEILQERTKGEVKAVKISEYNGYVNSSNIGVYKYKIHGKIHYCAEFGYQTDIDDFCVETHIFNKYPTKKTVKTIVDILRLEFDFKFKGKEPIQTCCECGNEFHWLDCVGDFQAKKQCLEEKYCGC